MSSFGQGWSAKLSGSMIVPAGSGFFATSTLGPIGTVAAAACCAPAPANMFLAMTAVITAMTSAPMSSATFFTSMARSPPPNGPLEQPQTSGKLVKKPLGENCEGAKGDRNTIRNLRTSLPAIGAMPTDNTQRENAAGERHQDEKLHGPAGREPQREGRRELDVAPAHHARIKSSSEQQENDSVRAKLDRDAC